MSLAQNRRSDFLSIKYVSSSAGQSETFPAEVYAVGQLCEPRINKVWSAQNAAPGSMRINGKALNTCPSTESHRNRPEQRSARISNSALQAVVEQDQEGPVRR